MPTLAEILVALFSVGGALLAIGLIGVFAIWRQWGGIELGKAKFFGGIFMSVVAVIGLWQTGIFGMFGDGSGVGTFAVQPAATIPTTSLGTPEPSPTQLTSDADSLGVSICKVCDKQSDGTNTLDVVIRNQENSSQLGYLAGSIAAESDGKTQDSATSTSGTTLSYTSLNVPVCKGGIIYVLGSAGVGTASARTAYQSCETVTKYDILGSGQNVVALQAYDNQLNAKSNGTQGSGTITANGAYFVSGVGATDGNAYYENTSLSTGGSIKGFIGYDVNGTSSVFGNYGLTEDSVDAVTGEKVKKHTLASDGSLFSYDSVDASKFSLASLTLTQVDDILLKSVACPTSITANRNAESCWSAKTLKDTDGEVQVKFQLKADLGDPTETGDNPVLCIDDKVYFRGADGNVKYDFFNSGGTNQGVGGTCLTFVMA